MSEHDETPPESETDSPELGLFDALPTLTRLRLHPNDKVELERFQEECAAVFAQAQRSDPSNASAAGKVNWCNVVAAMNATIAALVAAGVPVPPYMTIIVSILSSLCPNPPAP